MTVLDLAPFIVTIGERTRERNLRRELSRHAHSTAEAERFRKARERFVAAETGATA